VLSAGDLRVKYYIILDGCPSSYEAMTNEILSGKSYEIIKTDKIGNLATFKLQVDLLSNQTEADVVYFAEDDYLYKPGVFRNIVNLVREKKADFASCYFHRDTLTHPIHHHKREIQYFNEQLWITDSSTCMTFLTTKATLLKAKNILLTYSRGNNDCAMWLVLTKTHILNPVSYLRLFSHKESRNILKTGIKYSLQYFFSFQKFKLWIPYPGIGVHLEKEFIINKNEWLDVARQVETATNKTYNV